MAAGWLDESPFHVPSGLWCPPLGVFRVSSGCTSCPTEGALWPLLPHSAYLHQRERAIQVPSPPPAVSFALASRSCCPTLIRVSSHDSPLWTSIIPPRAKQPNTRPQDTGNSSPDRPLFARLASGPLTSSPTRRPRNPIPSAQPQLGERLAISSEQYCYPETWRAVKQWLMGLDPGIRGLARNGPTSSATETAVLGGEANRGLATGRHRGGHRSDLHHQPPDDAMQAGLRKLDTLLRFQVAVIGSLGKWTASSPTQHLAAGCPPHLYARA